MFVDYLLDSRNCPRYGESVLNNISILGNTCRHCDHETNKISEMLEREKKVIKKNDLGLGEVVVKGGIMVGMMSELTMND